MGLSPGYGFAHLSLGVALVHLGQLHEAAVAYERVVELDPDGDQAHLFLSDVYDRIGRGEESSTLQGTRPGPVIRQLGPQLIVFNSVSETTSLSP